MAAIISNLCNPGRRMLLSMMGIFVVMVVFLQFSAFQQELPLSLFTVENLVVNNRTLGPDKAGSGEIQIYSTLPSASNEVVSKSEVVEMGEEGNRGGFEDRGRGKRKKNNVGFGKGTNTISRGEFRGLENRVEQLYVFDNSSTRDEGLKHLTLGDTRDRVEQLYIFDNRTTHDESRKNITLVDTRDRRQVSTNFDKVPLDKTGGLGLTSTSPTDGIRQVVELEAGNGNVEMSLRNESLMIERYVRKMRGSTITFSEMESVLLKGSHSSSTPMKGRRLVARDRELISARLQIKNAPIVRNLADLHAPLFRNVSVFKTSYELMERKLKIYTYKEGEKPIFHHAKLRGIYAAEGWFMKLLERSKRFSVRDPKKAHLFYLPFSSETLRSTLYIDNSHSMKELEHYLTDYVNLIKKKYRFWNRTGGTDHFFVACHDWAPRITRRDMSSCIRALCNANAARGFNIGKDVSVPVTFVRSGNEPLRDIGGKPASERHTLAFFAGRIHGYLRPLLLKYWENKAPDMKIFGPMDRDIQGKAVYRDFMKSSKYCICARGYGVHTPRVVESIFYECVPVIISDNYVPPFFEVLDWEAFAVFIQERDIPNLRNILLSIPEDRYRVMQERVKMVQKHFVWHKVPQKYDLFHMILHSIWYNRVSQIKG